MLEEQVPGGDRQAFARLVVQVWTETLRNEQLALTLDEGYAGIRRDAPGCARHGPSSSTPTATTA
jgi:hypothetical protein